MIERLDKDSLMMIGGGDKELDAFIEGDFKVRSGMCPNGHGLLNSEEYGQSCSECGYWTNIRPELTRQ